jgi:bloom syndrome protein
VHETQVIDKEDFGADDTYISSTSHGSNLVSDVLDNFSGANVAPDRSAQAAANVSVMPPHTAFSSGDMEANDPAPTTSDSRTSCRPTFAAADEFDNRQKAYHGPGSDDELWNYLDGKIEDNNVVSPVPDQPTLLFPAVASLNPRPAETPSEASLNASSHYPEVVEKLRNVFRLEAFRKNQLAAIISILDGRDAIVLMPTGGGKSLCYQLPAVCRGGKTSGVTVVISPLRALMADQVDRLRSLKIDVMMLSSIDSQDGNTMHELRSASKKPSLLYVTPEKLDCNDAMTAILKDLYARQQLARFVIDEAHLINTWGRDFRSDGVRRSFLENLRCANKVLVCRTY